MARSGFTTDEGLAGWVQGDGAPVLLLHGGPGLSYEYVDGLAEVIGAGYRIASFQQRGLAPSTTAGPFDLPTAVADVVAVLDALGWERAWVVGHSWGGRLLMHLLVAAPGRALGGLAVDPLGSTGDGGMGDFEAAMVERTPAEDRQRAQELDERAMRGEGSAEDALESMRMFWPAYFASAEHVLPFPGVRVSVEAYAALLDAAQEGTPALERALPGIAAPVGCVAGADSPMPWRRAAEPTIRAIPGAWLDVVEGAGHFPWFERPGCVRAALQRLTG